MVWIIIGIILILVVVYLRTHLDSKSQASTNDYNSQLNSLQEEDFDLIKGILSKCTLNNPVKLSEYLKGNKASSRQEAIYSFLTSKEFKQDLTTIQFTELLTDNKPDVILSSNWNDESLIMNEEYEEEYITSDDLEEIMLDLSDCDEFDDRIEIPIRGINFRGLEDDCIGVHEGFLMLDKNNKHDRYAIGIYDVNGTHYGFVERGQKYLYAKIEENGGEIDCIVTINKQVSIDKSFFYGTIIIDKKLLV